MTMRTGTWAAIVLMVWAAGCSAAGPATTRGGPSLNDQILEAINQPESPQKDQQQEKLLRQWHEIVEAEPMRSGRVRGIVTDDLGNKLEDVELSVTLGTSGGMSGRPKETGRDKRRINGEFDVKTGGAGYVSVRLWKPGYEPTALVYHKSDEFRLSSAKSEYHQGKIRLREDGQAGIQVVLWPEAKWRLTDIEGQQLPAEAVLIARMGDSKVTAASKTGTYALVDAKKRIIHVEELRKGGEIGFDRSGRAVMGGTDRRAERGSEIWFLAEAEINRPQAAKAPAASPAPKTNGVIEPAKPLPLETADKVYEQLLKARRPVFDAEKDLASQIISDWPELPPAGRKAALAELDRQQRELAEVMADLDAGKAVAEERVMAPLSDMAEMGKVAAALGEEKWQMMFQGLWYAEMAVPRAWGRIMPPVRDWAAALADLKLRPAVFKEAVDALSKHQEVRARAIKQMNDAPEGSNRTLAQTQAEAMSQASAFAAYRTVRAKLTPAELKNLLESVQPNAATREAN